MSSDASFAIVLATFRFLGGLFWLSGDGSLGSCSSAEKGQEKDAEDDDVEGPDQMDQEFPAVEEGLNDEVESGETERDECCQE